MGIRDILIITTPKDFIFFKTLLNTGKQFNIKIKFTIQKKPEGIFDALYLAKKFVGSSKCAVILGDNIFYGADFTNYIKNLFSKLNNNIGILLNRVNNPSEYGVAEISNNKISKITEKPKKTKSNLAITGLYVFDKNVIKNLKKIKRGKNKEYQITDLLKIYLNKNQLTYELLGRGMAWLDTGTHKNMLYASQFMNIIEERQGIKISCPEEIAYRQGWISKNELKLLIKKYKNSSYSQYLTKIMNEK